MPKVLYQVQENWAGGVNTSGQPDAIGDDSSPRARNTALAFISKGRAVMQKRRGMSTMNASPTGGSNPAVIGQREFRKLASGVFTNYHVLVTNVGRVETISTNGTVTNISTALTTGDLYPDFATANNLLFIVNGTDKKKFNGTVLQNFGITAPASAPTLADSGVAGSPNGTYEARVTFYNSATGAESSAGPTSGTVTVASKKIDFSSIPTSADSQVTSRKLYLRNTSTQANFYLATTINDNTTTTYQYNAADSTLITLGPDTAENNPPPSGIKYLATHRSRLFAADDTTLYYSKVLFPEAFDPDFTESVNPNDGQKITAIHAAHDVLIIFKSSSMYVLVGDDPNDWSIRLVDSDIGCVSHRSVVTVEGRTYFWSEQGPMVWDGEGKPVPIGLPYIASTISADNLGFVSLSIICAAPDLTRQRVMFAVPGEGQVRNTLILPFNYRLGVWESDIWDPIDVASLGVADDANGQPWVFIGGYGGQVFKWWNADNDGVASGTTMSGTFVAGATSVSTITDAGAAFDTTGNGLKERKVTVIDSNGLQVGSIRPHITSNTATSVTLHVSVTGLTIGATYTYTIGGPAFELDTPWNDFSLPFHKKRYEFLFIEALSTGSSVNVTCDMAFNHDTSTGMTRSLTFTTTAPSAEWGSGIWDSSSWGTQANVTTRKRVGRTGKNHRVRLRNLYPNQSVTVLKIGAQAALMTVKS